jgi:hypothetical protein
MEKSKKKVISMKDINLLDMYNIPKIKSNDWNKWMKNWKPNQIKGVNKIRESYDSIQKETGIIVIEVILPISYNHIYWIDYVTDYSKSLYPDLFNDNNAYMMIVYKLNERLELVNSIHGQHKGILRNYKKSLLEYIDKFNKTPYCKCTWTGKTQDVIIFNI